MWGSASSSRSSAAGYSFHTGFVVAAIGMAIGLLVYVPLRGLVRTAQTSSPKDPIPTAQLWQPALVLAAFIAFVAIAWTQHWIIPANMARWVAGVAALCYFAVILTSRHAEPHERRRMTAYIPMWLCSVLFWSMFMQIFSVLPVLMQSGRIDFGDFPLVDFKPPWVFSINPVWVMALALVFAAVWNALGDRAPAAPVKFAIGLTAIGVAFLLFVVTIGKASATIGLYALIGVLGLFSLGEVNQHPDRGAALPLPGDRLGPGRRDRRALHAGECHRLLRHPRRGRARLRCPPVGTEPPPDQDDGWGPPTWCPTDPCVRD